MIFPLLRGVLSLRQAPVTWLLIAINAAVMLWGWSVAWKENDRLDNLMSDDFFLETQGHVYENYLRLRDDAAPDVVRELASSGNGDVHHFRLMGHMAFRDQTFLEEGSKENLFKDEVAVRHWRRQLKEIGDLEEVHPSFLLGVSTDPTNFRQWVTYIFSHTSGWHFLGNMVFLLIFGAALEEIIGGLGLMVVFVTTGVFAAGFFLWISGPTTAPLIGASGAISGVMAMYCVLRWNRPVRFLYWLLIPTRESLGVMFLPAWTILAIWALGDLAGYFGNLDIMGGVAHAAHIGGDIAGLVAGLVLVQLWKWRNHTVTDDATIKPGVQSWRLYPMFQFHEFVWRRK